MRKHILILNFILIFSSLFLQLQAQDKIVDLDTFNYSLYPELNNIRPELPSPFTGSDGNEYIIAVTKHEKYAIMPVTLRNNRRICKQLIVDTIDFPTLVSTGLHDDSELVEITHITGRTLAEITKDAHPGGLSSEGFMAADESILNVLRGDNKIVTEIDFTHPELAKPLFHVLNMMDEDLALDRWNMSIHRWDHIRYFYYNDKKVNVIARDSKGGQKSIFNDGIGGAFHITLWREFSDDELSFLKKKYGHLPEEEFQSFKRLLSNIDTGEMEPQYIMRYGFYEGHTGWRADPITIAFIFGLKTLSELNDIFNEGLDKVLTTHFKE